MALVIAAMAVTWAMEETGPVAGAPGRSAGIIAADGTVEGIVGCTDQTAMNFDQFADTPCDRIVLDADGTPVMQTGEDGEPLLDEDGEEMPQIDENECCVPYPITCADINQDGTNVAFDCSGSRNSLSPVADGIRCNAASGTLECTASVCCTEAPPARECGNKVSASPPARPAFRRRSQRRATAQPQMLVGSIALHKPIEEYSHLCAAPFPALSAEAAG